MMWNEMVNANCSRDRSSAVRSIGSPPSAPKVRAGEIDDLVAPAAHHRLHHVKGEAFRHLQRDRRRHGEFGAVDDGIDQNRAIVSERSGYSVIDLGRVLDPDAANANGFGHRGKIRFLNSVPKLRNPVDFCSSSIKPSAPLLNTTTFTGSPSCTRLRKSPISIENPPSPDSEITCRPGKDAWAPIACAIAFAMEPCQNDPISRRLPFIAR